MSGQPWVVSTTKENETGSRCTFCDGSRGGRRGRAIIRAALCSKPYKFPRLLPYRVSRIHGASPGSRPQRAIVADAIENHYRRHTWGRRGFDLVQRRVEYQARSTAPDRCEDARTAKPWQRCPRCGVSQRGQTRRTWSSSSRGPGRYVGSGFAVASDRWRHEAASSQQGLDGSQQIRGECALEDDAIRTRCDHRLSHARFIVDAQHQNFCAPGLFVQSTNERERIAAGERQIGDDHGRPQMPRAFDERRFVRDHENRAERRLEQSAYALGQRVMAVRQQYATRRCIVHSEHASLFCSRRAGPIPGGRDAITLPCPRQAVTSKNYEGKRWETTGTTDSFKRGGAIRSNAARAPAAARHAAAAPWSHFASTAEWAALAKLRGVGRKSYEEPNGASCVARCFTPRRCRA